MKINVMPSQGSYNHPPVWALVNALGCTNESAGAGGINSLVVNNDISTARLFTYIFHVP